MPRQRRCNTPIHSASLPPSHHPPHRHRQRHLSRYNNGLEATPLTERPNTLARRSPQLAVRTAPTKSRSPLPLAASRLHLHHLNHHRHGHNGPRHGLRPSQPGRSSRLVSSTPDTQPIRTLPKHRSHPHPCLHLLPPSLQKQINPICVAVALLPLSLLLQLPF